MARHRMSGRHGQAPLRRLFPNPTRTAPAHDAALTEYLVCDGDTFSSIARAHHIPTAKLLALNGLSWSSGLSAGQRLSVPAHTAAPQHTGTIEIVRHTIAEGETISAIAARHGVTRQAILSANGLHPTSLIFIGQVVLIPAVSVDTQARPAIETVRRHIG